MGRFELRIPFFRPLWRRVALTAVCIGWAALELAMGNPAWAALFGSIGAFAAWQFFLSGWPKDEAERNGD